jgi:hypothetical protein
MNLERLHGAPDHVPTDDRLLEWLFSFLDCRFGRFLGQLRFNDEDDEWSLSSGDAAR